MDAINAIVTVNWNTTRFFLIQFPRTLRLKFPFNEAAGLNEERILESDYYVLVNKNIQKIGNAGSKTVSTGFNLQVIGSDRPSNFSTDIKTTKFVFIDNYLE